MEKMNRAFEKVKIMVGMEVEDEEQQAAALEDNNSFAFMDEFNRNCTLSTKQVFFLLLFVHLRIQPFFVACFWCLRKKEHSYELRKKKLSEISWLDFECMDLRLSCGLLTLPSRNIWFCVRVILKVQRIWYFDLNLLLLYQDMCAVLS